MTDLDPFEVLGLTRDATLAEVRAARRRLAFDLHPDRGGSAEGMRDLNASFDAAVGHITGRRPLPDLVAEDIDQPPAPRPPGPTPPVSTAGGQRWPRPSQPGWTGRVQQDVPSFVIDALPAEAFEALLVVTSWIGEVLVDDPPYVLEVHLFEPSECWCRLDLVPDAGASTVSLTVAPISAEQQPPLLDDVRDLWVRQLNQPGAFA
ncbi:MAG TPA: J domain-containing protein [Ilumatobacteraceae bacterium]